MFAMAATYETMPPDTGPAPESGGRAYLDAVLKPNRSLPNVGFCALMAALAAMSFTAGIAFVRMGAWPVFGFFGLDVLAVWLAFRLSYRQGRLCEFVRVTADHVAVARRSPSGAVRRWTVSSAFARVHIDDPVRHESQVRVSERGRTLILGSFLAPEERGDFAAALKDALARARDERFAPQGSGGASEA